MATINHLSTCYGHYGSVLIVLAISGGCSWWPSSQLQRCQQDSNRLLSHYELESQRAKRLDTRNRELEKQVGDLEKRLAIFHGAVGPPATSLGSPSLPQPSFPNSPPSIPVSSGKRGGIDSRNSATPVEIVTEPLSEPPPINGVESAVLPDSQSGWRAAAKRKF